jgi:hypothetical protein
VRFIDFDPIGNDLLSECWADLNPQASYFSAAAPKDESLGENGAPSGDIAALPSVLKRVNRDGVSWCTASGCTPPVNPGHASLDDSHRRIWRFAGDKMARAYALRDNFGAGARATCTEVEPQVGSGSSGNSPFWLILRRVWAMTGSGLARYFVFFGPTSGV